MAAFHLSKWYLDFISDSGEASILYLGSLRWGMLRLHYSSMLECLSGHVTVRTSLSKPRTPEVNGSSISWRAKALGVDAVWKADSEPIQCTIFSCDKGSVEWHCFMPRARAQIGERFGFGYVEQLTMSIPPWELPMENLRWGRFTSASDWIVWIDWRGEFSRRIAYWNGEAVAPPVLEDDCINFGGGALLTMDKALVIRDAPLGAGALRRIPGINRMFPVRLLQISERKWRSRARLVRSGRPTVEGWAIHENVSWPR